MKKLTVRIVILLILLWLLSTISCSNKEDIVTIELDGTRWALISIDDSELIEGSHISLYFRDGSVWGSAGCNIYWGDYLTEYPDILTIPPVGQHEEGCILPEGILEQEDTYTRSLTNSAFYRVAGEHLEIYNAENQKLLTFERKPEYPMDPADLVGTSWQLVSMNGEELMEGLSITLTFDSDSEASGRAGCFDYELPYEANGDDIEWGIRTKRDGELPQELEREALRYTDIMMWGANYRLTPDRLEIFTAKGDTLVYEPSEEENNQQTIITPVEFWFPENLRWLTEGEKNKAIEIALNTPEALEWRQKESQYNTEISWVALYPDPSGEGYSGYRKYEYEIVETGIPIYPPERIVSIGGGQKDAEIYPDVTIWFGEPVKWIVSVAVNLDEEKAVYVDEYPAR